MNSKSLIRRVFSNLRIDNEDTAMISEVRNDLADTIRAMKIKAESPNRSISIEVNNTISTTYDFTTLPDNSVIDTFIHNNDRLELETGYIGTFTLSKLHRPVEVKFDIGGSYAGTPAKIMEGTFEVLSRQGTVLYTESFDVGIPLPITFTIDPAYPDTISELNVSDYQIRITLDGTVEPLFVSGYLDNLIITIAQEEVKLPDDWFLPLPNGVSFNENTNTSYRSREVSPGVFMQTQVNSLDSDATLQTVYEPTQEVKNVVYNTILYYFDTRLDGTYLVYKKAFTGSIDLNYVAIENLCLNDDDNVGVISAFVDAVVAGATIRGLRRKMLDTKDQVEILSIRILLKDYKAEYIENVKDYVGRVQETSNAILATPFTLGDLEMDRREY